MQEEIQPVSLKDRRDGDVHPSSRRHGVQFDQKNDGVVDTAEKPHKKTRQTEVEQLATMNNNEEISRRARSHALSIMAKDLYEEAVKQRLIVRNEEANGEEEEEVQLTCHNYSLPSSFHITQKVPSHSNLSNVSLRISKGDYACWPSPGETDLPWITSLSLLNVGAAITVRSTVTNGIIELLANDAQEVVLSPSSRIQVLDDITCLAKARKAQGVAFIRRSRCMVVWSDKATTLLQEARQHQNRVHQFLWKVIEPEGENDMIDEMQSEKPSAGQSSSANHIDRSPSSYFQLVSSSDPFHPRDNLDTPFSTGQSILFSPLSGTHTPAGPQTPPSGGKISNGHLVLSGGKKKNSSSPLSFISDFGDDVFYEEKAREQEEGQVNVDGTERPVMIISCIQHGFAAAIAFFISTQGVGNAIERALYSKDWSIMALFAILPAVFVLVMFFCDNILSSIIMLVGPVRQLEQNSRYHSGKKPLPLQPNEVEELPHITIQMPVYKESLEGVLKPSFESVKKAIQTYELQGGSASIIVSEDGMVLVDEEERNARLAYYEENNITWIARPKHGDQGFVRAGRFKKASNLNFTYEVMRRVELRMKEESPSLFNPKTGKPVLMNSDDRMTWQQTYDSTLQNVLRDIHPTAAGSGFDQIGDFILMIDSDTRIPIDCFMDAASEMTRCKDVGVLQYCSGVMQVTSSFFESCIAYFTRTVNLAITFAVANGDVAPFMGHNAYLRWSAMKEIAREEVDEKGRLVSYKIWSEEHVSEDFVMALDMLDQGYLVRWATYDNNSYLEGVSLTCTDELNRWQKYAWGVSEMIFNPLWKWYKGPFTPLIRRFWFGKNPIHYKWAASSYCFSYYALGLAFPLSIALTLVKGWFDDYAEGLFNTNFETFVSVIVVYLVAGSLSLITLRFRAGKGSWFSVALELVKHIPFMIAFFGGLSYHVLTALLAHILGINMSWGATLKDVEQTTVWAELPEIFKRFWKLFLICVTAIIGVSILQANFIPLQYQLYGFFDVFPIYFLAITQILYPFVLNPNLLQFSF